MHLYDNMSKQESVISQWKNTTVVGGAKMAVSGDENCEREIQICVTLGVVLINNFPIIN